MRRESGLLLHRRDGVPRNIGQQVGDVQALGFGGGDGADRRREPGVLDDLSGQIGRVVPGLGDQVGDPAQFLFVDTLRGTNPVLRRYQAVLWVIALIYLVWPLDFIPDLLPLLGVSDDIGVGAWLVTSLYAESGNYLASGGRARE